MDWLGTWKYRIKITIDKNDITAALSNFPVLIYLSASSGINNEAWLWIKVPSISASADTILYIYYDNSKADNTTYVGDPNSTPAEKVWDDDFKFVSHMRDDPDNTKIRDSTKNDNDGTKEAVGNPTEVSGKISEAQEFDETKGITVSPSSSLNTIDGSNGFTISLWVYAKETEVYDVLMSKGYLAWSGGGSFTCTFAIYRNIYFAVRKSDDSTYIMPSTGTLAFNEDEWTLITFVFRPSDAMEIWVNKTKKCDFPHSYPSINTNLATLHIGKVDSIYRIKTIIDEARISNIARSDAWIGASYESGRDHLLTFGAEEEAGGPVYGEIDEINRPWGEIEKI